MKKVFAVIACILALLVTPFASADAGKSMKFDAVYVGASSTLIASPASASSAPFSFSSDVFYDFSRKASIAVVSTPTCKVTNIFGKRDWYLDTSTFAGADANGYLVGGVALTRSYALADQVSIVLGYGLVFTGGERPYGGLRAGITFRR